MRLASVVLLGVYSRQPDLGLCDDPRTRSEITGAGPAPARHMRHGAALGAARGGCTMVGPPTGGGLRVMDGRGLPGRGAGECPFAYRLHGQHLSDAAERLTLSDTTKLAMSGGGLVVVGVSGRRTRLRGG